MPLHDQTPAKPIVHRYSAVRVHLDEIELVERILKGNPPARGVVIRADSFTADTAHDLREMPSDTIKELWLSCEHPTVSVSITRRDGVSITSQTFDLEAEGLAGRVAEVLRQTQRPVVRAVRSRITAVIAMPLVVAGLIFYIALRAHTHSRGAGVAAVESVLWLGNILMYGNWFARWRGSAIVTRRAREAPPFLRRNRDALLVGIGTTIFGWLLGHYVR